MPDDSSSGGTAFQLALRVHDHDTAPEIWRAWIHPFLDDPEAAAEAPALAEAIVYRVHYANPRWGAQLEGAGPGVSALGSAFADRELVSMLDESSLFTDNLCVIASLTVGADGDVLTLSRSLVGGIVRVFDGDSIASVVAEPGQPEQPARALWVQMGFVDIPGTTSMLLPVGARP